MKDVLLTLMPLAVIYIIKRFLNDYNHVKFLSSTDFAFANVILFSTALTDFIKLKTEIQKDYSNRLYGGSKMFVSFIVISVVFMAFSTLANYEFKEIKININYIVGGNVTLMICSLLMIVFTSFARHYRINIGYQKNPEVVVKILLEDALEAEGCNSKCR